MSCVDSTIHFDSMTNRKEKCQSLFLQKELAMPKDTPYFSHHKPKPYRDNNTRLQLQLLPSTSACCSCDTTERPVWIPDIESDNGCWTVSWCSIDAEESNLAIRQTTQTLDAGIEQRSANKIYCTVWFVNLHFRGKTKVLRLFIEEPRVSHDEGRLALLLLSSMSVWKVKRAFFLHYLFTKGGKELLNGLISFFLTLLVRHVCSDKMK